MTHTQNYNLSQWSPEDRILRSDFNTDNAAIDTALAAHDATLANLTAVKGNCQIEAFSYIGTGVYGTGNPTVIRFRAMPLLYFILGPLFLAGVGGYPSANISTVNNGAVNTTINAAWSNNILRLTADRATYQANFKGETYNVVAFYAEDADT